jgi:hypothetical protein
MSNLDANQSAAPDAGTLAILSCLSAKNTLVGLRTRAASIVTKGVHTICFVDSYVCFCAIAVLRCVGVSVSVGVSGWCGIVLCALSPCSTIDLHQPARR